MLEAKEWLEGELSARDKSVAELLEAKEWLEKKARESQKQLDIITNSLKYKTVIELGKVFDIFFAEGSKRRIYTKNILRAINRGIDLTRKALKKCINGCKVAIDKTKRPRVFENIKWPSSQPLVSIVIPCFNYGKFIEDALQSVEKQTFQNFEIIVVDGGSTDGSQEYLKQIQRPKIKVFLREGRHLVGDNRNYGIKLARGKYICCLDADDMLEETYLEKAVFYLETYQYDVVYPSVQCFGELNEVWFAPMTTFERMMQIGNSVPTVAIFSKEAWRISGGYKDWPIGKGHVPEDWEFWTRMMGYGFRFKNLKEALMLYRVHKAGLTAHCETTQEEQRQIIYKENEKLLANQYLSLRKQNNARCGKVNNHDINLRRIPNEAGMLMIFPVLIPRAFECVLESVTRSTAENYAISIVSMYDTPIEYSESIAEYKRITREIYQVSKFLDTDAERVDFISYLIYTRAVRMIINVNSALDLHWVDEISKRDANIKIVEMKINDL